ncbi:polysaccharide deacetylase family protein [Alkalicoccus halolimnae]|uniref:Polysaccharide deacetylase family protein n=1 Tax=Alkalicoccus halolimnae TaxID=1667239 RepID=A0A5C7FDY7_9BACI|nr:polysaccharide deacetylase family protein [Alkalicoccus halolimnae]TXF85517.1 polysaccharide deacetylase family protein [Alkalicoccus halolimnae]
MKKTGVLIAGLISAAYFLHLGASHFLIPSEEESEEETVINNRFKGNFAGTFPVLMYRDFDQTGQGDLVVSAARFEEQLQALNEAGYETINEQELIEYENGERSNLPDKPVLITMDDGYNSNYDIAYPILKSLDMEASIYTVVKRQDNEHPDHFTWDEAKEMVDSGHVSIQLKTYDLHGKILAEGEEEPRLTHVRDGETKAEYRERVEEDLRLGISRIEEEVNNDVTAFAFPFSSYNDDVLEISKSLGIELFLTLDPGVNKMAQIEEDMLRRINVQEDMSGEELVGELDQTLYENELVD